MVNETDITVFIILTALTMLLAGSFLMSASEIAFFAFKPEEIKTIRAARNRKSIAFISLTGNPEKLLNSILISNSIINISAIFVAAFLCIHLFPPQEGGTNGFILSMAVFILILLLAGEILPRMFATVNHFKIAMLMVYPLTFLTWLLYPLISLMSFSSLLGKRHQFTNGMSEISKDGDDNNELLNDNEKILKGITNFGNTSVSAIMCPRIDVTAIDIKSGFDKIIPVIINSGFSRIPVYSGSFDSIKGILYAKDVLPYAGYPANFRWQSLLRSSYFVPETKKINDLLKEFQLRKIHMAIVIDEYGGTSGIVTLEDILEEIVGDITDENDEDHVLYRKLDENRYLFEGKILLHDFCRILNVEDEIFEKVKGESETLAGLMLELAGEIPQKDQIIKFNKFVFRIESVDRRRIREVYVEINMGTVNE
ncbi:MAG TPA: gliding motility-associated protein GldE [Bacteroidales bacterium]|nr:gliding motility-associated protein GldE [Bacteroidales bacterium]